MPTERQNPTATHRSTYHVPPRIRALNKFLPQGIFRWRLSSADALEAAARQRTGRRSELSANTRQALRTLLQSYADSAQLHPLGEIMTAVNILSLLEHQLGVSAAIERSPSIAKRQITAPLIITGMPRTGSTLLHNLLAIDPQWRVPLSWEATNPVPIPRTAAGARVRQAQTNLRFALIEGLHPGFRAIHELNASLPQECLVISAAEIRSHLFFSSAFVPDYQDWLDREPQTSIYTHHRRFLQYLQNETPTTRWALKAPSHLFSLTGLVATYPDARIVHTHRAPDQVIGSIASLHWHLYRTFSYFDDREELGRQLCDRWSQANRQFKRAQQDSPHLQKQTFQINYEHLIAAPMASVQSLYDFFKLRLDPNIAANMQAYLNERPQHHFGKHSYRLADYGLTRSAVQAAFGE